MHNVDCTLILVGCVFENNGESQGVNGGGIYNSNSSSSLTDCTFTNNIAKLGGGMYNYSSSTVLTNCTFDNNDVCCVNPSGAGMYNSLSNTVLINCTFTGNTSSGSLQGGMGGGWLLYGGTVAAIESCTITDNNSKYGGRLWILAGEDGRHDASATLMHTTVCSNAPDQIYGEWTDNGGNTVADECPVDCLSDINGDGNVDVSDLLLVIGYWGSADSLGDLNQDGIVDVLDLLLVIAAWGPCE